MNHDKIEGVPANFTTFYKETQPSLQLYLSKLTKNPEVARDLTQDTFERVHTNIASFKGGYFKSWVYAIAINVTKEYWRRQKLQNRTFIDSIDNLTERENNVITPEEEVTGMEIEAKLQSFAADPENQNDFQILLLDIQGYSDREMGDLLNLKTNTVSVKLSRVRRRLAQYLEK